MCKKYLAMIEKKSFENLWRILFSYICYVFLKSKKIKVMVKKSLTVCAALLMMAAASMQAQTFYVGTSTLGSSWAETNGSQSRILSFDLSDVSTHTGEFCAGDVIGENPFTTGTSAGDTYYGIVNDEVEWTGYQLCAMNFETNEVSVLSVLNSNVISLAFDEASQTLYGLEGGTKIVRIVPGSGTVVDVMSTGSGAYLGAIAFDDDGKLWGFASYSSSNPPATPVQVWEIDLDSQSVVEKGITENAINGSGISVASLHSAVYEDGLFYLIADNKVASLAPETLELQELGELPLRGLKGMTFTKSTSLEVGEGGGEEPEPEPEGGMYTSIIYSYGDAMGSVGRDDLSGKTVFYYDADNKLVREAAYGAMYGTDGGVTDEWMRTRYITYLYNEQGQLVSKSTEQYGQYEGTDWALEARDDTMRYEYDDQGRLAREIEVATTVYTAYEYDDEGQIVRKTVYYPDRYNEEGGFYIMDDSLFSDFAGFNKPQRVICDGRDESSKLIINISYDENGNRIRREVWNADETEMRRVERWSYDPETGMQTEYVRHAVEQNENGEWVDKPSMTNSRRSTYTIENDDPNRIRCRNYEWAITGEGWVEKLTNTVVVKSYFNEMYSADLEVEPIEGELSSYRLTFNVPNVPAVGGGMAFDIIRDGEIIKRIETTDPEVDLEAGTVTYDDMYVKNGEYDYMVQSILYSELKEYETPYNVSNIVVETPYVELPASVNVRAVAWDAVERVLSLTWELPAEADTARLQFQYFNIWQTRMQIPDNVTEQPIEADPWYETSYDMTLLSGWDDADIYIENVYAFGKSQSDTIHVDLVNFEPTPDPDDPEDGIADEVIGGKVLVEGDELLVTDGVAKSVVVYSVNGVLELREENTQRVSLGSLTEGVHLAVVTRADGNVTVVKFVKD